MLAEAVREVSGAGVVAELRPVRVDAAIDAYVPADYVPLEAAKIDVHRRIALAQSADELRELVVELHDRFGPPPPPVENLVLIQEARLKLAPIGADYLTLRGGRVTIGKLTVGPAELRAIRAEHPRALYQVGPKELSIRLTDGAPMRQAIDFVDGMVAARRAA
jgi:transcription-repair coupling factor (superfamily II helicase)